MGRGRRQKRQWDVADDRRAIRPELKWDVADDRRASRPELKWGATVNGTEVTDNNEADLVFRTAIGGAHPQ